MVIIAAVLIPLLTLTIYAIFVYIDMRLEYRRFMKGNKK